MGNFTIGVLAVAGAYITTVVTSAVVFETESKKLHSFIKERGYKFKEEGSANKGLLKRCLVAMIPVFNVLLSSVVMYFSNKNDYDARIKRLIDFNQIEKIQVDNELIENNSINSDKSVESKIIELSNDNVDENHYNYAIERAKNLHCKPKCLRKVKENK